MKSDLPKPTLNRLVKLQRLLEQIEKNKTGDNAELCVTSSELEKMTGWSRDTIRRDISQLETVCSNVNGYNISSLKKAIEQKTQIQNESYKCCLVGLGKLGEALIDFKGFKNSAFSIVAGFDSNVNRTEILSAPFPLYTTTRMESVIKTLHIDFAILAVPENAAQQAAEKIVSCGIKGIVNFTPAVLSLPAEINIENVSVLDAVQKLAAKTTCSKE